VEPVPKFWLHLSVTSCMASILKYTQLINSSTFNMLSEIKLLHKVCLLGIGSSCFADYLSRYWSRASEKKSRVVISWFNPTLAEPIQRIDMAELLQTLCISYVITKQRAYIADIADEDKYRSDCWFWPVISVAQWSDASQRAQDWWACAVTLFCLKNNSDVEVIGSLLLVHCVLPRPVYLFLSANEINS
jgi:hypothetical protein